MATWLHSQLSCHGVRCCSGAVFFLPRTAPMNPANNTSPEYIAYIKSSQWRNIRQTMFKMRGKKCERCGSTAHGIEVYHLNYDRFGKERAQDLLILCHSCHEEEDAKRKRAVAVDREKLRTERGFETWYEKRGIDFSEEEYEQFLYWLENRIES